MTSASEDVDNMFPEDFEYTAYPIEDTHEGEPSEYFEDSAAVLTKVKEDRSLIFVHCTGT
jgi:protein-tyrosine phosphatase